MEDILKNAYAEVDEILDILGKQYKKKVPQKLRKLFKQKKNNNYKLEINKETKLEEINLSRTAIIIISILNLKYWEKDPDKIKDLKRIYDKNEKEYQNKINKYKENGWLQKNRKHFIDENVTETSLLEEKNISIIAKIKRFFRNLIFKEKRDVDG